jgi:hypothetical protein
MKPMSWVKWSRGAWFGLFWFGATIAACGSTDNTDRGCPPTHKACDETCVALDDPSFGCASKDCAPCDIPFARAACGPAGECVINRCGLSHYDCDQIPANGCEAEYSLEHCGACNNTCPSSAQHTREGLCIDGVCKFTCEDGYGDVDLNLSNGCEQAMPFTTDADCPKIAPQDRAICEQLYWPSTICRYAHPALSCTVSAECVVPLDVTTAPYWSVVGQPCP